MSDYQKALNQASNRIGGLQEQLEIAIRQAVTEARATGQKTSVTVTLHFDPMQKSAMAVGGSVKTTLPKVDGKMHSGIIFTDSDGNVFLNPQQGDAFEEGLPPEVAKLRQR
jgi:hypothetical protein